MPEVYKERRTEDRLGAIGLSLCVPQRGPRQLPWEGLLNQWLPNGSESNVDLLGVSTRSFLFCAWHGRI